MDDKVSSRIMKSIDDYVNGKLSPDEVDRLWADLLMHPEYYPLLRTRAALQKKMVAKKQRPWNISGVLPAFSGKSTWVYALSAILLLALFVHLYLARLDSGIPSPMDNIDVIHMITPDVARSSANPQNEIEEKLSFAFLLSISDQYDTAIEHYTSLLEEEEYRDSVMYNLAILHYNAERYDASVSYFEPINCSMVFDNHKQVESCLWFKTNSYLANQNLVKAKETAVKTMEMNGSYRNQASRIVDQLQKRY